MRFLRRHPKAIVVVLVLGALVAWLWHRAFDDIRYFEVNSGISFPRGISEVKIVHPREFCFSGRLKIPKGREEEFLKSYGFRPANDFFLNADLGIDKGKFEKTDLLKNWYGVSGRSPTNRWELAYNPVDQGLWFVMLFPDFAGDSP